MSNIEHLWPLFNLDEREALLDAAFSHLKWSPPVPNIHSLVTALSYATADDREFVEFMAQRVFDGVEQYGHLDIGKDKRNWDREALAEAVDGAFYVAVGAIKRQRTGLGRK